MQTKEDWRAAPAWRKAQEKEKEDEEAVQKALEQTALGSVTKQTEGNTTGNMVNVAGKNDNTVEIMDSGKKEHHPKAPPVMIVDSARKEKQPAVSPEAPEPSDSGKQPEDSPEKKKTKTSTETPVRSLIKQGRCHPSTPAPRQMHLHEHKRAIIEAGLALDSANKFETLVSAISSLITYYQVVDKHFVINLIMDGGRTSDWTDPKLFPTSMTELGAFLKISGSLQMFDKQKGGQGKAENKALVAYFSFAVSSDIPPHEIMAQVNVDWNILGGAQLAVKHLGVF